MSTDREAADALRAHVEQITGTAASINDDQSEYSWRRAQEDRGREMNAFVVEPGNDLVSDVLTAIEQLEEFARDAMQRRWLTTDNYIEDENGGEVARFELKRDAQHAGLNGPLSVLRLCRAHRDIVNLYTGALFTQSCHPEYEGNNAYVKAMEATVRALAEGLGVSGE